MLLKSRKRLVSVCAAALLGLPALNVNAQALPAVQQAAPQGVTIADIRLEGLQRVAASTVFGRLNVKVGDRVSQEDISRIIRDVFATDYFEEIQVLTEENVLIVRVKERPTISELNIKGNKLIPTEALTKNMEKAGLAVGQVFQPSTLEGMQVALQDEYVSQGMYGAKVDVEIKKQDRNRVGLDINVTEGDASKIVHINIVGNSKFDEETLLKLFELREHHLTSMFKKDDRYSQEKIKGDLERLTSYYMDQGYVNFAVTSTQVSLTPDKSEVYITVNISEGDIYKVNEVKLAGDLVDSEELLRLMIQVEKGQVFSQQLVKTTSDFMTTLLSNRGYFFAKVEGVPKINEADKTVDLTFFVEPGDRTYVNRITFKGNTNTADEVLRRELRQMEGAPASKNAMEQSKVRMERLGYFKNESVKYKTNKVPGVNDQVDVEFEVEEQLNGQIGGSIGYGQVIGLQLTAQLQQVNFLGTGKTVGVNMSTSAFSTNYNFSFFDPYYTIDGVSRGFTLGYSQNDYAELNLASYSTNQINASVTYGYLLSETEQLSFNLGLSNTKIEDGYGPVQEIKASPVLLSNVNHYLLKPLRDTSYFDPATGTFYPIADAVIAPISNLPADAFNTRKGFLDREGSNFTDLTLNITWTQSTLNQGLFPTRGGAQSFSFEFTVPGSDLNFYRMRYYKEHYFPVYGEWIIHARADLGFGDGYGQTEQLPFFQNFSAGGLRSIRGFERNTLGPRATFPQEYLVQQTAFLKDEDGNIALDLTGSPIPDASAPYAYMLEQERDADGNPRFDAGGQPIYKQKLARQDLYSGKASPIGGNIQTTGTVELLFPLPFVEDRSRVRSGFFIDAGNVFSSYCEKNGNVNNNCLKFSFGELRYSAGISVSYQSGVMGIMSISFAKAFNTSNIDETEMFQFDLGTAF